MVEPLITQASHAFLRDCLRLAVDVSNRAELQSILESKLRLRERQGDTDAKAFDVAGGFAPTIGVMGTVVGLIDVLKQFSDLTTVAAGTGIAFLSTMYGLALANHILLPTAQRIRARVADESEVHELIVDGTLCLYDGVHPALMRDRLQCFLRPTENEGK